jgi:hypothetical protein
LTPALQRCFDTPASLLFIEQLQRRIVHIAAAALVVTTLFVTTKYFSEEKIQDEDQNAFAERHYYAVAGRNGAGAG